MGDPKRGLIPKFTVTRNDGKDALNEKHHGCQYFVLDITHDPHALAALEAYAASCREALPLLAEDLDQWVAETRGNVHPFVSITIRLEDAGYAERVDKGRLSDAPARAKEE